VNTIHLTITPLRLSEANVLTEEDVRKLLARKAENKNLDYKEAMNWNTAASAQKGAVVKDVLAMSNSHKGGCLLFGVRDSDFQTMGLSEDDFKSFDVTRFTDFLNRYADPPLECAIQKFVIDGKRIVAIDIPEFTDVPIICKADLNDAANRQVLKRGATYIRTERGASEVLSTVVTMREMLDRAVVKRGDQFINMVDRVIAGQTQHSARAEAAQEASVVTSKAAIRGQCKTGHARKPSGTRLFYSAACCGGKSVFVRQLRGPHLSTCPW
jgi:predicted HTH transcriptional regulator